jgi:hypothetical protein
VDPTAFTNNSVNSARAMSQRARAICLPPSPWIAERPGVGRNGPRGFTADNPTSATKELPMPPTPTTRRFERQTKRARRGHISSLRSHKASGARFVLAIGAGAALVPGGAGVAEVAPGNTDGLVANDRPGGIPAAHK